MHGNDTNPTRSRSSAGSGPTSIDWKHLRSQFAATEGQTWLNTATYGPGPRPVHDAVAKANENWASGRGVWREWEEDGERAREGFARLMKVAPETIALFPVMSAAAGQIAENLQPTSGANLVVGDLEFRSNFFPFAAQADRGIEVRVVSSVEGRLPVEDMIAAMDHNTRLVAASSVQSMNGFRIDLESLAQACANRGAKLFIDATQSVGVLDLPLTLADYVAVSGYKWLLAPRGTAFLYVRSELIESMRPIAANWKTPAQPYDDYYGPPYDPPPTARRFDLSLAWPSWVGAARAFDFLEPLPIAAIQERALALATSFREALPGLGLHSLFGAEESSQIVALEIPDPQAIQKTLEEQRVIAAVRGRFLRVSFHFFNDETDVDRALEVLRTALAASR